ncbi:DUF3107 domain-containing protein [Schaalia sp. 19OD2882]|uniref:DUF3107 domain-containing protein n=1 Tax=Schaalia sp. 19OD2882 TaxID=2794089 RepID=UPI001C1F0A25|nr:DUF3107 domain-containing protein [Schaalia sp. 19OD2882]QWW20091.1 DUF3107 domain-containing protein [Schaalia sp. 19OD2882]
MITVVIGVRDIARELTVDLELDADRFFASVDQAVRAGTPVQFTDTNGDRVLVPSSALGFVQVVSEKPQRVGFSVD